MYVYIFRYNNNIFGFVTLVVSHKGTTELYMMYIPYGLQIHLWR